MFLLLFLLQNICAEPSALYNYHSPKNHKVTSHEKKSFFHNNLLAGIIKIPSKQKGSSYNDLPGTSDPKIQAQVDELIKALGENGKISLLLNHKKHLTEIGENLRHVHPLRFIGCIFSKEEHKKHMKKIYNDYFKWNEFFTKELLISIKYELKKDNIFKYLDDFSKEVNKSVSVIKPFFEKNDWEGLLKFLIEN